MSASKFETHRSLGRRSPTAGPKRWRRPRRSRAPTKTAPSSWSSRRAPRRPCCSRWSVAALGLHLERTRGGNTGFDQVAQLMILRVLSCCATLCHKEIHLCPLRWVEWLKASASRLWEDLAGKKWRALKYAHVQIVMFVTECEISSGSISLNT